jgi:ribosomal protein L23
MADKKLSIKVTPKVSQTAIKAAIWKVLTDFYKCKQLKVNKVNDEF